MEEEFQPPLFCYHQKRGYEKKNGVISVICLECRLAGPGVKVGRSEYLAKLKAQREYFKEANRVDDYPQKHQNRET